MKVTQKWTDSREVDYKAIFHHGTFPAAHKREWASLLFHESRLIFHPSPSKKKKKAQPLISLSKTTIPSLGNP